MVWCAFKRRYHGDIHFFCSSIFACCQKTSIYNLCFSISVSGVQAVNTCSIISTCLLVPIALFWYLFNPQVLMNALPTDARCSWNSRRSLLHVYAQKTGEMNNKITAQELVFCCYASVGIS